MKVWMFVVLAGLLLSGCETTERPAADDLNGLPPLPTSAEPVSSDQCFTDIQFWPALIIHSAIQQEFEARPGVGVGRAFGRYISEVMARPFVADGMTYKLDSPELVGLLIHNAPRLYKGHQSFSHMMSAKLRQTQTRSLTLLEQRALAVLESSKVDVVPINDREELGFLGALRAREDCLQCHSDKREGDLLGALRYRLKPVSPDKEP